MHTHTTTIANTAALLQEFFDGFRINSHLDGKTLHVYTEKEIEMKLVENHPLDAYRAVSLVAVGAAEENQEDWKMLLDRWDF